MYQASLILEGGAMRGIFTAGVLDYLMEQDCWFSHVIGVSIGSCNATDYISKQIGRTRDCMALKDDSLRYITTNPVKWLKKREVFDMDMIFDKYPNQFFPFDYETYFSSPITCEIVTTNCVTGQPEYMDDRQDRKRLMSVISASCSMPYVNHTVEVDGVPYFDGGVADPMPILHSMKLGFRKNVIVSTRYRGYRKKPHRWTKLMNNILYAKYPGFIKTMNERTQRYNKIMDLVDKWEMEGNVFVIHPETAEVSRTEQDYDKLMAFYDHGCGIMKERFGDLVRFLEKPV